MQKIMISKDWQFRSLPYCYDPSSSNSEIEIDSLDLPHDYLITQPRDKKTKGGVLMGYFQGEGGEYTKYMDFGNWEHAFLNVDGAYMCSKVYLNDQFLYMHPHGYTPYLVDLTDKMWKNTCNRITIITQNLQPSTRWYTGAGLYRDVFLWVGGKVRMEPWDVFVTTKSADEKKAIMSAAVTVTSDVACQGTLKLTASHNGAPVTAECALSLKEGKNDTEVAFEIDNPQLWDGENPNLYDLTVTVTAEDGLSPYGALLVANTYSRLGLGYELHMIQHGPHGYSLADETTADGSSQVLNSSFAQWHDLSVDWLYRIFGKNEFVDKSTSRMGKIMADMGLIPGKGADFA